jgi:hypothetical protein
MSEIDFQSKRGGAMSVRKIGDLQVWWIPQIPGKAFEVDVDSVAEGAKLLNTLANYDLFQLKHHIKPDYSNAGGLRVWSDDCDGEGNPGWNDWYDDETGEDDPAQFALDHPELSLPKGAEVVAYALKDGKSWFCCGGDFVNLQVSDNYSTGNTKDEAIAEFANKLCVEASL